MLSHECEEGETVSGSFMDRLKERREAHIAAKNALEDFEIRDW